MSAATTDRPAFRNLDVENEFDRPPFSKLAIVSLMIGLVSLVSPISFYLLPISLIAIGLGALVLWQLSRDKGLGGSYLAQAGLGLGIISTVWCLTASIGTAAYLHKEAARNAKLYLELLSQGEVYQALELHVPKQNRQIAGTDLASHYRSKTGEKADLALEILESETTKSVVATGKDTEWEYHRDWIFVEIAAFNRSSSRCATRPSPRRS
jgi:cytochrome c biogenesis protein CcdA